MKKNIAILIDEEIEYPKDYQCYTLNDLSSIQQEYENIYIADLIDYLSADKIKSTLEDIVSKLTSNGKLHIKAPDILQLCWYCSKLHLDLSKFRYIIYQTGRKSCYSMDEILLILNSIAGTKIELASYINAYEYSITIIKHESN
jgi:uncharacterized membrane protein